MPPIVICGTDTDVGKTIVSSLLVQGLEAIYWKPIQSGLEDGGDTGKVCELLNLTKERYYPEIYKFKAAVSPHWAAEKENLVISPEKLVIPITQKPLIIETAGGIMVPLNRTWLQADQLQKWMCPVVLVARSGLGTLNHTLLSVESLQRRGVPILGLIVNGPKHQDNPRTLEKLTGLPVISELPILKKINSRTLAEIWNTQKLASQFKKLITEHIDARSKT